MVILFALGTIGIVLGAAIAVGAPLLASFGERMGGDTPLVRRRSVVHLTAHKVRA